VVNEFSPWEDSDIAAYLELRGVEADDVNMNMVRKGLRQLDWNFDQLDNQIELLRMDR
jgi:hypothetical protein